jgi:adenylate cyclase
VLGYPSLDVRWEHHPSHFWLVLLVAAVNTALGLSMSEAARRRGDPRIALVGLAFLAAAGFLGLHALATPGVLLEQGNVGFTIATPVGLLTAAVLAFASSLDLSGPFGAAVMRWQARLRVALLLLLLVWGGWSLASLQPLDGPLTPDEAEGPLRVLAVVGVVLYGAAAWRYRSLAGPLPLAVLTSWVLLAEAMVAVAFGRNWQLSWWEWHVLMALAFALVAGVARSEQRRLRPGGTFASLYLEETRRRLDARFGMPADAPLGGEEREVSVLFADLEGFTSYSETRPPAEVISMLNEYWGTAVPIVLEQHDGVIERFAGDAVMVVFNARGDQPDHARRAAAAALDLQARTLEVSATRPDWPRFRAGVSTGAAAVGYVGAEQHRNFAVIGDTTNTASRLQTAAKTGEVVIAAATRDAIGDEAVVETLPPVEAKGKREPVAAFRLVGLRGR